MLVTALSPVIGHNKASKIAHHAMDNDLTLKAAALKLGFVTEDLLGAKKSRQAAGARLDLPVRRRRSPSTTAVVRPNSVAAFSSSVQMSTARAQFARRAGHFSFVGGVQGLSKRRRTIGSNVSMGSFL
jgi:hypothetical protein